MLHHYSIYTSTADGLKQFQCCIPICTQYKETGISDDFPIWMIALDHNTSIFIDSIDALNDGTPAEYEIFKINSASRLLAVPYSERNRGFFMVRNQMRHIDRTKLLQIISYVIVSEVNAFEFRSMAKSQLSPDCMCENADVTINLFDELEICTENGRMNEDMIRFLLCCKLLLHRNKSIQPREIASQLWPGRDIEYGIKLTHALVYRFRKYFNHISDDSLIVTTASGYRINEKLWIHTDYDKLEIICKSDKPIPNSKERLTQFDRVFRIHKVGVRKRNMDNSLIRCR